MSLEAPLRRSPSAESVTRRHAVRSVASVVKRIGPWRQTLLIVAARVTRKTTPEERQQLLAICEDVTAEIASARVDLIHQLMDVPDGVAGHSRVADVENALESLDAAISGIRSALAC